MDLGVNKLAEKWLIYLFGFGVFYIVMRMTRKYWISPVVRVLFAMGYWLYLGRLGRILHLLNIIYYKERRARNPHSIAQSTEFADVKIVPIPSLSDNYSYVIVNKKTNEAIVVDAGDANPVKKYLSDKKLDLVAVLTTHKHWDHAAGNNILKNHYDYPRVRIYGGCNEPVLAKTRSVKHDDMIEVASMQFKVLSTPGHTKGHVVYVLQTDPLCVFTGDLIFVAGNGMMFEGTPSEMLKSIKMIMALPGDSLVFPGHEYSLNNLTFAASLLPLHAPVQKKWQWVKNQRSGKLATVPSTLSDELEYNPFMLTDSDMLKESLGLPLSTPPDEVLYKLRQRKDDFVPITH